MTTHTRLEDAYEPPAYPVDDPPTFRARCSCWWVGPSRYKGITDRDWTEHANANPSVVALRHMLTEELT